jgi:hypothetical protein
VERLDLEFRTDLFNDFHTTQFSNPTTNLTSATFGQVLSTNVRPRIPQVALKLNF